MACIEAFLIARACGLQRGVARGDDPALGLPRGFTITRGGQAAGGQPPARSVRRMVEPP